ncbi:MAG: type II toxin-antitoxin system PemK/MazF family toxin [Agathobacter sp.]
MYVPVDGDIYLAKLPYEDYLQSGLRPVIIAQNTKGNASNHRIHMIPITSKLNKANSLPTHVLLRSSSENGLKYDSVALVEDCRPHLKSCLIKKIGSLSDEERSRVGKAFRVQFPLVG